jgi:hypothetical protein
VDVLDLISMHFRNSNLAASAMIKYSRNFGVNEIEVFLSDYEEFASNDPDF